MNVEKLNQKVENADDPTSEKRQDFDESAKRKSPDKKNQDSIDEKKEKGNDENEEQKDREKKSMDEKIQGCQKQADLRMSAYQKQIDDINARNKELDEQAKTASERTDFITNITKSALMPGTINTDETSVKPHASAMPQEQFTTAVAAERPADQAAAKEKNDAKEKQAAAKEQPTSAVAGQDGDAKKAAA